MFFFIFPKNNNIVSKFKTVLNPFDILFSFLAIGFLYRKNTSDNNENGYQNLNGNVENNSTRDIDSIIRSQHTQQQDASETSPLQNDNDRLPNCSCNAAIVFETILIIISLLVSVTLIIYLIYFFFEENALVSLRIFKKFVHAPFLLFLQIFAFYSLKRNYELTDPKSLNSTEKLLLTISPFLFLYEIFKIMASTLCKFDDLSSQNIQMIRKSGEIIEAICFILADFFQTSLIIQANRSTKKSAIETIRCLSFSSCCLALIIMNMSSLVIDILGTFRFEPFTLIEEACYGEQFQIILRNILTPPIIFYRVLCSGLFYVLRTKRKSRKCLNCCYR